MNYQVKNFEIKMEVTARGWIPPELNPKFIVVYKQYGPVRAISSCWYWFKGCVNEHCTVPIKHKIFYFFLTQFLSFFNLCKIFSFVSTVWDFFFTFSDKFFFVFFALNQHRLVLVNILLGWVVCPLTTIFFTFFWQNFCFFFSFMSFFCFFFFFQFYRYYLVSLFTFFWQISLSFYVLNKHQAVLVNIFHTVDQ